MNAFNHRFDLSAVLALAFLMSGLPLQSQVQRQHHFFYGTVYEEGTRRVLTDVNLKIEGTRTGSVTDRTGAFSFFIDTLPSTLVVSYVGFETKRILLDKTSFRLTIYLKRKVSMLQEVEITARAVEAFYRDDRYAVLDYNVDSSLVWLMIYRQKISRSELICMNLTGDTVARSEPLTFRPVRLFRDCIGTLHVLSRDSGFQVFREDATIRLLYPVKLKKFEDVLKNCVAATDQVLYFKKITDQGLGVEYYGVNRKSLLKQTLARVADEKKLKMKRRNLDDASLLMQSKPPSSRDDFVTWNFVHKILYRPVRASLFIVGNYICIFDTPSSEVEFYDRDGNFSYKLHLQTELIHDGRWTREIHTDPVDGMVYTTFLNNGSCSVYRIDLNDGTLKFQGTLAHAWPEKILVYNGWVYYLYDLSVQADNKMLFRQKL